MPGGTPSYAAAAARRDFALRRQFKSMLYKLNAMVGPLSLSAWLAVAPE